MQRPHPTNNNKTKAMLLMVLTQGKLYTKEDYTAASYEHAVATPGERAYVMTLCTLEERNKMVKCVFTVWRPITVHRIWSASGQSTLTPEFSTGFDKFVACPATRTRNMETKKIESVDRTKTSNSNNIMKQLLVP